MMKSDFSGYATKNDIRCSDGRIIRHNAFQDCDGLTVPLVYQHDHSDPANILGHAILENRDDGVYCYGYFNNTDRAQAARESVKHGDINSLSIYANQLVQNGPEVTHGMIREVSLVLAGANPGATIENVAIEHSDGSGEYELPGEAVIFSGDYIRHGEDPGEVFELNERDNVNDKSKNSDDSENSEDAPNTDDMTVKDVIDSMNELQKGVMYTLIAQAADGEFNDDSDDNSDDNSDDDDDEDDADNSDKKEVKHSAFNGGNNMGNIFEQNGTFDGHSQSLSHADQVKFMEDAAKDSSGSFRRFALQHAQDYGIESIDTFFPDAKAIRNEPDIYKRDTEWVADVLSSTNHTPFSRIKSQYVDITSDSARAKGYTLDRNNNHRKTDEIIKAYKRVTTPTTVYKKQKLDRDDILDITDFDVVNFLMREMRVMLDEEVARAILIGDGRAVSSEDHINTESIRPIVSDDDLYVIRSDGKSTETPTELVDRIMKSKVSYQGSGQLTAYISPELHANLMTQRDQMGRRLYDTDASLAAELGVSKIVEVPLLTNYKDESGHNVMAILVNLRDYSTGTDRGGEVNSFNDFDIDYNQQKYLLETRLSGALTLPKSAIVITESAASSTSSVTPGE